jgi:hypothetical protein
MDDESIFTQSWVRFSNACGWLSDENNRVYVLMIVFSLSTVVLYFTMFTCQVCVVGVLIFSLFFCCEFRSMLAVTASCLAVMWFHKWSLGGLDGLSFSWDSSSVRISQSRI